MSIINYKSNYVCWLSLDPINNKIDYYPLKVALELEKIFLERNIFNYTKYILEYNNSTIHFNPFCVIFQTINNINNKKLFKEPYYRSVKRYEINSNKIKLYTKCINGEWRIVDKDNYYMIIYDEIPNNILINNVLKENSNNYFNNHNLITTWSKEDIVNNNNNNNNNNNDNNDNNDIDNKNVIVWMWCKHIKEYMTEINKLSNNWWIPYLQELNNIIENAFVQGLYTIEINLPLNTCIENSKRVITFEYNGIYAKQIRYNNYRLASIRQIKRKIIKIGELKKIFINMLNNNKNNYIISSIFNIDNIPYEYICPISQDIIIEPVKTCDGHIYDKKYIEKWLEYNNTSPLTGLPLNNKNLEIENNLKENLNKYIKEIILNKLY